MPVVVLVILAVSFLTWRKRRRWPASTESDIGAGSKSLGPSSRSGPQNNGPYEMDMQPSPRELKGSLPDSQELAGSTPALGSQVRASRESVLAGKPE